MMAYANEVFTPDRLERVIDVEMALDVGDISLRLAREIADFEPCGEGNREPLFVSFDLAIREMTQVGNGDHVAMRLSAPRSQASQTIRAIAFGFANEMSHLRVNDHVDVCYSLEIDEGNGQPEPRLVIRDFYRCRAGR